MNDIIWHEDSGLTITAAATPDNALVDYLANVPFGNAGNAYWRVNIDEQLKRFEHPVFMALRDGKNVIGSYVLDRQKLMLGAQPCNALYRGLLSIHPERRNAGLGRELAARSLQWAQSLDNTAPDLSYGVVDGKNAGSLALLNALGMQPIGTLCSMIEYHQWRGKRIREADVRNELTKDARLAWDAHYARDDGLRPAQPAEANWLSVSGSNGQLAACRHHVTEIRLGPLGGLGGFIVEKLMPLFPPGHRRFNPRRFRYVAISEPVVPDGSESLWRRLVSHLMTLHDTHFVMFTLDPQSPSVERLRAAGVIGKIAWRTRTELKVMAMTHDDALALKPMSLHLSARDL